MTWSASQAELAQQLALAGEPLGHRALRSQGVAPPRLAEAPLQALVAGVQEEHLHVVPLAGAAPPSTRGASASMVPSRASMTSASRVAVPPSSASSVSRGSSSTGRLSMQK